MPKENILCVDDDPKIIEALSRLLRYSGYNVCSTSLETATLELATAVPPNLILLDITMPSRSGLRILEELKRDLATSDIPVLIVSGRDEPQIVEMAVRLGAEDFISKPFDPDFLLERVRKLIDKNAA